MKEGELREHAVCDLCGNKIGSSGLPLFWIAVIQRHGVLLSALRRQDALSTLLGGSAALAQATGPDEDMTTPMMHPIELTICETCAMEDRITMAALEKAAQEELPK